MLLSTTASKMYLFNPEQDSLVKIKLLIESMKPLFLYNFIMLRENSDRQDHKEDDDEAEQQNLLMHKLYRS